MTIFLTSHFMDEVEALCDEICILKKGQIAFYGTIMQAIEKSGCEKFEDAYLTLAGYSSGDAMNAIEEVARSILPNDYTIEWGCQSYQEKQTQGGTQIVFALALIMVFLILAAQYESWSLPIAVVISIPFAALGAGLASYLRGYSNDIYFQVAIVTLVGLAAKNAILIIEFAVEKYRAGNCTLVEAALTGAQLRFRPIIMTSLAFIFGCLPLALSSGAGAASRNVLGTAVVGGMIFATILLPLFVPIFFKWIMWLSLKLFPPKNDDF